MTPLQTVLEVLENVRPCGKGHSARCPAHEDRRASLKVDEGGDGRVLLFCHAGCEFADIVKGAGLTEGDLFPPKDHEGRRIVAEYDYTGENGERLFQAVRYSPKDFRQRRRGPAGEWIWNLDGTRRVLFHLPELLEGVTAGATIFVVEGEKDVLSLESLGLVATCNPMGAGKWREEYGEALRGARVVVIPDADSPGRKHAAAVAASLKRKGAFVAVAEVPIGKDASEWIASGATREDFEKLTAKPSATGPTQGAPPAEEEAPELASDPASVLVRDDYTGPRFPIGIEPLDALLGGGLAPGFGVVIGGEPEAGKTSFVTQVAVALAWLGVYVLVLGLDESLAGIARRIGQLLGFQKEEMRGDLSRVMEKFRATLADRHLFLVDERTLTTVEAAEKYLAARAPEGAPTALVFDSLQTMGEAVEGDEPPRLKVKGIVKAMQRAARRPAIVVTTSEVTRGSYASQDPTQRTRGIASYSETSAIEFRLDVPLTLIRDGDRIVLRVHKNRLGHRRGDVLLGFDRVRARYLSVDLADHEREKEQARAERVAKKDSADEARVLDTLASLPPDELRVGLVKDALCFRAHIKWRRLSEVLGSLEAAGRVERHKSERQAGQKGPVPDLFRLRIGDDKPTAGGAS